MPAKSILQPRTGRSIPIAPAFAALALGLSLAAATPFGASAKSMHDHGEMHPADHGDDGADGSHSDPRVLVLVSGSGAVAAVTICHGESHAATAAGGVNIRPLLAMTCADPGDESAALAVAASGALAATTGGLALTAPAATAPSLGELAVLNAVTAGDGGMDMGHHEDMHHDPGVMEMGMDMSGHHDMHAMAMAKGHAGHGRHGGMMGIARGEDDWGAMHDAHAGRGGAKAATGGAVSALPSTGVGAPADPALVLAVSIATAIASAGAAGGGLALRRRGVIA